MAREPAGSPRSAARGLRLPLAHWLGAFVTLVWVGPVLVHHHVHGVVNPWQVLMALFLAINLLICIWEVSLFFRIGDLERDYAESGREGTPDALALFRTPVAVGELFTTRLWARTWAVYSRYDPGYSDRRSFGFAIDVGNGFASALPSLLLLVGLTFPILPARVLGVIGLLLNYQKLYGTLLYAFTFVFNRRYRGHRARDLIGMVVATNGVWIVFPLIALYVCLRLVFENRYDFLWS